MTTRLRPLDNTLGADFNAVWATSVEQPAPPFELGTRIKASSNGAFVYGQAAGTLAVGDVVSFSTAWVATGLSTANDARGQQLGVAVMPMTVGQRGWFQVNGFCAEIHVLASAAANVRLNTTGTAGALDDDATATTMQAEGIYLTTARGGTEGNAPGVLNNPMVGVTL